MHALSGKMSSPPTLRLIVAFCLLLVTQVAVAQTGTATLQGTVTSAADDKPVADVVVTVTSPALLGEQMVVTDSAGYYRIPSLPPGQYTMRLEMDAYRPYDRTGIDLRADATIRVNAVLLPETLQAETVVVVGKTPAVDVGSSSTGASLNSEFTRRVPLSQPGTKGSANRSIESVATVAPGASSDQYGTSMNGTTSPENGYKIDGLSVSNPGFGTLGTPLSTEFVKEVNVVTGGYLPEYGRSMGGILNVVTETGSNEFHGSLFSYYTPGQLAAGGHKVRIEGQTLQSQQQLSYIGDVGFDLGGPIVKDKLWFYTGFDIARTRYNVDRWYNICEAGFDADGKCKGQWKQIEGSRKGYIAELQNIQAMAKLTWAINNDNRLTLTGYATPSTSGDNGEFAIDPATGNAESDQGSEPGSYSATAHQYKSAAYDGSLKWTSEHMNKRLIFDTTLGIHHQDDDMLAADGTGPHDKHGYASQPNVWWRRSEGDLGVHSILDFENFAGSKACMGTNADGTPKCPAQSYYTGGPGFLSESTFNHYQAQSIATYIFQGLGHHVFKAGVDVGLDTFHSVKSYSGGQNYQESDDGSYFEVNWASSFGVLTAPDKPDFINPRIVTPKSLVWGAFLQDSWSIVDLVTLNLGVRYDAQYLYNSRGDLGLSLPNQWSPRVGAIYDILGNGQAKAFVNYARYYQNLPLDLADVTLTGEPHVTFNASADTCDPTNPSTCTNPDALDPAYTANSDPNQKYQAYGAGASPIDPNIKPPSSDELSAGGEYEIFEDGRLGVTYTRRWLNKVVEDMSNDNGATYFLGNPGYGIGSGFPKAKRNYDALTLFLTKAFADTWLAQVSYTLAFLRGNYPGLFRPESGDLLPGHGTDFDLKSLMINRYGYLPGDRRHDIKVFGSKDWPIAKVHNITTGTSFRAHSGEPTNYLGAHPIYEGDEAYILKRGSGERLPWEYAADVQLGYRYDFDKSKSITFTVDIFNIFDFQNATGRDEVYTSNHVVAVPGGTKKDLPNLVDENGDPLDPTSVNPNFGKYNSYQAPRIFRFGLRGTF